MCLKARSPTASEYMRHEKEKELSRVFIYAIKKQILQQTS